MGAASQSEVTYTYKIANLAPWAERSDVQREFGDVRTTVNGISKSNEIAGLQLTTKAGKFRANEVDCDEYHIPSMNSWDVRISVTCRQPS